MAAKRRATVDREALEVQRAAMDWLNAVLGETLRLRGDQALRIARWKKMRKLPLRDGGRERQMVRDIQAAGGGSFDREELAMIARAVFRATRHMVRRKLGVR